jgi:ribosomal protein S18 acetylase RimI-like enzyme
LCWLVRGIEEPDHQRTPLGDPVLRRRRSPAASDGLVHEVKLNCDLLMNLAIEAATAADVPAVARLFAKATAEMAGLFHPPFGAALSAPAEAWQETSCLESARSDPDSVLLVGRGGSEVVAFGLAVVDRSGDDILPSPRLTIAQLAVTPRYRGRGIGSAVLAAMESRAKEMGLAALDLSVFEGNDAAAGLFRQTGFRNLEHRMGKVL